MYEMMHIIYVCVANSCWPAGDNEQGGTPHLPDPLEQKPEPPRASCPLLLLPGPGPPPAGLSSLTGIPQSHRRNPPPQHTGRSPLPTGFICRAKWHIIALEGHG